MSPLKTSLKIGLQILTILAQADGRGMSVRELALGLGQSEKYLEQLIIPLRRSRLVISTRGPRGGYRLARPEEAISLLEVVNTMQGAMGFCDCPTQSCQECVNPAVWQALEILLTQSLATVTLADLVSRRLPTLVPPTILSPAWVEGGLGI